MLKTFKEIKVWKIQQKTKKNMYAHKLKMYIQEIESKIIEMDGYNCCLNISEK